jgi:hypothetical protein
MDQHDRRRPSGPFGAELRRAEATEDQRIVEHDVQNVRGREDQQRHVGAPDAFEESGCAKEDQMRRQPESEYQHEPSGLLRDDRVRCEQSHQPGRGRGQGRHAETNGRGVRQGAPPDAAAAFEVSAAEGRRSHDQHAHQQPDRHDQQEHHDRAVRERQPCELGRCVAADHDRVYESHREEAEPRRGRR